MPIHDYIIDNGTGAAVRADINLALSAIVSLNSSATQPGTMYAYQLWADTALGLLKIRNSTNSAWITLRQLDGDFSIVAVEDGLLATPSLTFTNDLNTGIFRPSTDSLGIVTGGQYAIACTSTQAVGIRTANPSAALHVAGIARVGADDATDAVLEIGAGATGNREAYIDLVGDTTYFDYGARFGRSAGANGITYFAHRGTGAISIQTTEAGPITFTTTGTERLRLSGSGDFVFKGAGTTPGTDKAVFFSTAAPINSMVLDSSGRLLVGTSSAVGNYGFQIEQSLGSDPYAGSILLRRGLANASLSSAGYSLGTISAGSQTNIGGSILFESDAAWGSGDYPTRLVFSTTPDSGSSPTERMRIKANGDVSIVTGNLIIGTAGKGIDFSADGNAAGMTSELLNDYEEGTWTPAYSSSSGTLGAITYENVQGTYVKVGRLVTVTGGFYCSAFAVGTGSGDLRIGGLPFTGAVVSNAISVGDSRLFTLNNPTGGHVVSSNVTFFYRTTANGAINNLQVSDAATGSGALNLIYFTASYQI